MITDKPFVGKMIKITCIFMLVIFIFTSCASKNDESTPFLPAMGDGEISEIRVIIGKNESLEIIAAAEALCEKLSATVGKSAYVSYAGDITATDGATEIWLGYESTAAAQNLMRDMRTDDFMCREVDGVVVLGGKSDRATVNAIERFCREILPLSTKYRLVPENGGFDQVGTYEIDKALINGVFVKNFEIVVESRNDEELLRAALYLQRSISDRTGYWLDIVEEGDRNFESNGIFLKWQSRQILGVGRVLPTQYGFDLSAEDHPGLVECIDTFVSLFAYRDGDLQLELDREIRTEYFSATFRISSMRLDGYLPFGSAGAFSTVMKAPLESKPDIIFTGIMSEEDNETVLKSFQGYSPIKDKNGEICGYFKNVSCEFISATEGGGIVKEYYTVESHGVKILLVRISGSPTEYSDYADILQPADERGLPVAVISQTDNQSVSSGIPEELVKKYSERITSGNESFYFECYTAGSEFSEVELAKKGTGTVYREIRINIEA